MDRAEVHEFIKEVLGPNTPREDQANWVSICCPLAEWKHAKGTDNRPSAGISVQPGGTSIFNCMTCHTKYPLFALLDELMARTGEDWSALADAIEDGEYFGASIPQWGSAPLVARPEPIDKTFHFDLYEPVRDHPYLRQRGITRKAAATMELLHDPGDGGAERILFPVYGYDKQLYGFSGRAVDKSVKLKVKDYYGLPKAHMLLGAHLILPDDEFVIAVEGLFDYAKFVTYELPVLAFMSSTLTEHQAEIIKDIGKPLYFFHDDDKAGLDARDKAKELLWRHIPMMKVRYPRECTVETDEGDLRPPEDPAELTKDQVLEMIDDARLA